MPEAPKLHETPDLPMDDDGPVFDQPWQAQAFAMVVKLFEAGHFTWNEWVDYLSAVREHASKTLDQPQAPSSTRKASSCCGYQLSSWNHIRHDHRGAYPTWEIYNWATGPGASYYERPILVVRTRQVQPAG